MVDINDFDNTLRLIDCAIDAGEDIWELVTDAANHEEETIDIHRWNQCDLAARVEKCYNADRIGEFAVRANLPKKRAQEYAGMGRFYSDRSARAEFFTSHPTVTYSHLRKAKKLEDQYAAYKYDYLKDGKVLTVEQLGMELEPSNPANKPLLKGNARLVSATPDGCITFAVDPALVAGLQDYLERFVNVVVKAV